eukprot:scaffold2886_cov398-Prasinococcus_capsulatus_cf.AAC.15
MGKQSRVGEILEQHLNRTSAAGANKARQRQPSYTKPRPAWDSCVSVCTKSGSPCTTQTEVLCWLVFGQESTTNLRALKLSKKELVRLREVVLVRLPRVCLTMDKWLQDDRHRQRSFKYYSRQQIYGAAKKTAATCYEARCDGLVSNTVLEDTSMKPIKPSDSISYEEDSELDLAMLRVIDEKIDEQERLMLQAGDTEVELSDMVEPPETSQSSTMHSLLVRVVELEAKQRNMLAGYRKTLIALEQANLDLRAEFQAHRVTTSEQISRMQVQMTQLLTRGLGTTTNEDTVGSGLNNEVGPQRESVQSDAECGINDSGIVGTSLATPDTNWKAKRLSRGWSPPSVLSFAFQSEDVSCMYDTPSYKQFLAHNDTCRRLALVEEPTELLPERGLQDEHDHKATAGAPWDTTASAVKASSSLEPIRLPRDAAPPIPPFDGSIKSRMGATECCSMLEGG